MSLDRPTRTGYSSASDGRMFDWPEATLVRRLIQMMSKRKLVP